MNQTESDDCAVVMPDRLSVRANISAPTSDIPIATSYETICADERRPPSSAYFEFDDHPARMSASTPTDEMERTKSSPRSEEHTSELQSRQYLVCRLLLAKKIPLSSSHSSFPS